jgi:hypothetical protein
VQWEVGTPFCTTWLRRKREDRTGRKNSDSIGQIEAFSSACLCRGRVDGDGGDARPSCCWWSAKYDRMMRLVLKRDSFMQKYEKSMHRWRLPLSNSTAITQTLRGWRDANVPSILTASGVLQAIPMQHSRRRPTRRISHNDPGNDHRFCLFRGRPEECGVYRTTLKMRSMNHASLIAYSLVGSKHCGNILAVPASVQAYFTLQQMESGNEALPCSMETP